MRTRLEPFVVEHFDMLAGHVAPIMDLNLLAYANLSTWLTMGTGFSLFVGEDIIGSAGIVPASRGIGEAWGIFNPAQAKAHAKQVVVTARAGMKALVKQMALHRIETVCPATDDTAKAWLVVLGFKPESLMRWYGPDKSDYYKFVYLVGE